MQDVLRPHLAAARLRTWICTQDGGDDDLLPLEALCAQLGIDIASFAPATQPPGTLGYLEPDEDLIFLQQGLPETVRRFTLAHELGHAVLHRSWGRAAQAAGTGTLDAPAGELEEGNACDEGDLDAPLDVLSTSDELLRPGQAYSARSRRESEANIFAATLLLPAERLRAAFLAAPSPSIRTLAARFGVSEDVVLRRLADLLAPLSEGLAGDTQPGAGEAGASAEARLDAAQRAAAMAPGPALVIAGPGTGKTSTLVGRIAFVMREQQVTPVAILALTFSNKAAREMRDRIERLLYTSAADTPAPLAARALPTISTIHAFCGDLLRRYAPLVGLRPDYRLVGEAEGYFLLREAARRLALLHYQPVTMPALYFPDLLGAISRAKDELIGPEAYAAAAEEMRLRAQTPEEQTAAERALEVAAVYAAYQAALAERGDPDYGDLIMLSVRLLEEHPEVRDDLRARYQAVLVDEFQDINRAMGVLLRTLVGEQGPIWAVGDADQAIYRFRGASPENLTHFTAEYRDAHVRTLRHNYRSLPGILTAAAGFARETLGDMPTAREALVAMRADARAVGAEAGVTLATAADEPAELAGLVAAIQRAKAEGGRAYGDQAVLCRTRRQAQRIVQALEAAGIPMRVMAPLLEQPQIKDVLAVTSLLAESSGSGLLRAGSMPDHAFSRDDVRALLAAARERHCSPLALLSRSRRTIRVPGLSKSGRIGLRRLRSALDEMARARDVPTGLARYLFEFTIIGRRLLREVARGNAHAREEALLYARLLALAHAFEDVRDGIGEAETAERDTHEKVRHADWHAFLEYVRVLIVLRQEVAAGEEVLTQANDGVAVLTVHASKGLEFPVVYLPGLADRRFPLQRQRAAAPLPEALGAKDGAGATESQDNHLREEACLFYVAVTRARDQLVLSYAERYGRMRYRPSPFLAPIERCLGARLIRERWAPIEDEALQGGDERIHDAEELPALAEDAPVSVAALETYLRCPRQYAYRYIYDLHPEEQSFLAMRRGVQETLRALEAGASGSAVADASEVSVASLTLAEALAHFERAWADAEGRTVEMSGAAWGGGADPFREVYGRYGRLTVERAWRALAAGSTMSDADEQAQAMLKRMPPRVTEFGRQVAVDVGGHTVTVTLDRVERDIADQSPSPAATSAGGEQHRERGAVRYVRHGIGSGSADRPDLRALLYALAAAQEQAAGQRTEVHRQQLATGARQRIELSPRQTEKLRQELDTALDGMEHGRYEPKPEPRQCQSCPFLLICPA